MVLGKGTDKCFDVSAGFGGGRDGRDFRIAAGKVRIIRVIGGRSDQCLQGRVGSQFFTPRIRCRVGIEVGFRVPYARAWLGDACTLQVAGMCCDTFQCLLADGVGEGILLSSTCVEVDKHFESFTGNGGMGISYIRKLPEQLFDGSSTLAEIIHGKKAHPDQVDGSVAMVGTADPFSDDDRH